MVPLLDRRLVFVTGKGGVGKTSVAAALGLLAAEQGKRTLVAEVDAKGNLADFFEVPGTGYEPREIAPNLLAMTMHTEDSLKEYLRLQLKLLADLTGIGETVLRQLNPKDFNNAGVVAYIPLHGPRYLPVGRSA